MKEKGNMNYVEALASLRVDRAGRWGAQTNHRAPHKALMLLAVIHLISQGHDENLITFSDALIGYYRALWREALGSEPTMAQVAMPFYRLSSDGFWHLIQRTNEAQMQAGVRRLDTSRVMLEALYIGVRLDDALFAAIVNPLDRAKLVQVLIDTYFANEARNRLITWKG